MDENFQNINIEKSDNNKMINDEKLESLIGGEVEENYKINDKDKDRDKSKEIDSKEGNKWKNILFDWFCPCCVKENNFGGNSLINRKVKVWWSGVRNNDIDINDNIGGFAKGVITTFDKVSGKEKIFILIISILSVINKTM